MKMRQFFIGTILTLLIGGLIYILFRSSTLIMFTWLKTIGLYNEIAIYRRSGFEISHYLPNWIMYALPDGLWMFSYVSFVLLIWQNSLTKKNLVWIFIIPCIAIVSEIGQFLIIIPGTFDIRDIVMYSIGTILPFIFFKIKTSFTNEQ